MGFSSFLTGISLRTWLTLILIASLVGFHFVKIEQAKEEVRDEMQAEINSQVKDGIINGLADYIKTQDGLLAAGAKEREDFASDIDSIRSSVSILSQGYQQHAASNPVSPDCYYDPFRVRFINQALHPTDRTGGGGLQ